ncbi:MAG TPA: MlaD family protein [Thermoleophilaceae bacterium]|nr:MlaD family protein [Thermoleophilaceae bacterium]
MRRRHNGRVSAFGAGLIALVVIVIALYAAFVHKYPWNNPYELKAVFANANNLAIGSPVREAGVVVGKVTKIETKEGSSASVVTMDLKDEGLPIHRDATVKIRPRIFLEGNFFVDLSPGSPEAPEIASDEQIPMSQTYSPVQIDQVLDVLQGSARDSAQRLIQGYGDALNGAPRPGEDKRYQADPATRGQTAAQSLNDSLDYAVPALKNLSIVNEAFLGREPHDLSRLIDSTGRTAAELNRHERSLQSLVTSFNTTMAAFASQATALQQTIHVLPDVLVQADNALLHLNQSFPPLRAFSREILPGVRETPATVAATFPWITQTRALVSPAELQGLVDDLRPSIQDLASTTDESIKLFPQVDAVSRCFTNVLLPTGDIKVNDPPLSTGVENYKEFWQALTGLSGESQNFDGNGSYTRFQTGGGSHFVSTGQALGGGPSTVQNGNAVVAPIGARPARPAARPPYNRTFPCYKNPIPDINGAATTSGP